MAQLKVTPEQLRERAKEYRDQSDIVEEVIGKLDGLMGVLEEEWEGASASKYRAKYEELLPSFKNMQELIATLAEVLDLEAQKFEEADNSSTIA